MCASGHDLSRPSCHSFTERKRISSDSQQRKYKMLFRGLISSHIIVFFPQFVCCPIFAQNSVYLFEASAFFELHFNGYTTVYFDASAKPVFYSPMLLSSLPCEGTENSLWYWSTVCTILFVRGKGSSEVEVQDILMLFNYCTITDCLGWIQRLLASFSDPYFAPTSCVIFGQANNSKSSRKRCQT